MDEKFLKPYDPSITESRIYAEWEKSGLFNPDNLPGGTERKPFTIMMPPPNATGILHMGHALGLTIQDILIRYKRMQGFATLWLPGTDHAAIATQSVVEKQIKKDEGLNRHDLGREELLKRIDGFVTESRNTIQKQTRILGASCDWSREAFTLDEKRNNAVNVLFKRMYDAGLIYRGMRIVNWDPKGQTTISDDEVVYEERSAKLYTFRYSKDFPIPVATTRPETKVGDVAVAVHPDDARYTEFIGKEYDAIFCDVPIHIKVVADKEVDPAFGTGAVGVTPAHSQTDWDIADRHGLSHEVIIINEFAKMTVGGRIKDKKTTEAREIVVEWLKTEGLLEKEEDTVQNISTAERTGGIIEPLPKLQWFIDVNKKFDGRNKTLKELILEPVQSGAIKIIPEHFEKTYFHWIENLRDWCISRQIWYGHRIPVWYKGEDIAIGEAPVGDDWTQDEDTLDTWFSSGSWTFSTLGWPDTTNDLKRFHPTDVMVHAYEILFFWTARMILMTEFALNDVPFRVVYLTGVIRDSKGRKFSKSLGNGIDPIDIAEKFGTDAGRMSLVIGNTPGADMRMSEDKIKGYKHFANKLWNIARFILENTANTPDIHVGRTTSYMVEGDVKILSALDAVTKDVTNDIEEFRIYMAAEKIYHYAWHELADKILEESKQILAGTDANARASRARLLLALLDRTLRLLHPFMPFITEEIYQSLPDRQAGMPTKDSEFLMIAKWPS
jgi:valyl-tRNA synthetase